MSQSPSAEKRDCNDLSGSCLVYFNSSHRAQTAKTVKSVCVCVCVCRNGVSAQSKKIKINKKCVEQAVCRKLYAQTLCT